jgi:hypothetical protein
LIPPEAYLLEVSHTIIKNGALSFRTRIDPMEVVQVWGEPKSLDHPINILLDVAWRVGECKGMAKGSLFLNPLDQQTMV